MLVDESPATHDGDVCLFRRSTLLALAVTVTVFGCRPSAPQVLIFADATTSPTFQASLDIHPSGVNDVLVIE